MCLRQSRTRACGDTIRVSERVGALEMVEPCADPPAMNRSQTHSRAPYLAVQEAPLPSFRTANKAFPCHCTMSGVRRLPHWRPSMNGLFRPSILAIVSIALAISAIVLVLWPRAPENRAVPLPVDEGDQEIVWLYAATNAVPWERFVEATGSAVQRLAKNR